jgi:hypothetical protein
MQVSGQLLPRRARFSRILTPILAYFNAVVVASSPSHEAYINTKHAIQVVHVKDGQVKGASEEEDIYFFRAASSVREEAMQVCKAFLYSELGFSAARRGRFIEMIASCLKTMSNKRW